MCGIAGIVFLGKAPPRAELSERLKAASNSIFRRGPDDEGQHISSCGRVGFAHRRLSILGLGAAGQQPMKSHSGLSVITFNGEIYNFEHLKTLIKPMNYTSTSDTEPLVEILEQQGEKAIGLLDGMFAFSYFNILKSRLLFAVDPAGKKPLYTYWDGKVFAFASELKALWALGYCERVLLQNKIPEYLFFGYVPAPFTIFKNVRVLEAGHFQFLDLNQGPHKPQKYWDLPRDTLKNISFKDASHQVRNLVQKAVKKRLVSEVPVGAFLSGGLDSSVICLEATKCFNKSRQLETFSVGFDSEAFSSYDESAYARKVAQTIHSKHTEIRVKAGGFNAQDIVNHFDEPFADSSALPSWILARECKKHVSVALSGDGGDEVFGGYLRFRAGLMSEAWAPALRLLLAPFIFNSASPRSKLGYLMRLKSAMGLPLQRRLARWNSFFNEEELVKLFDTKAENILDSTESVWKQSEGMDTGYRILHLNFKTYLFGDLLPKVDRMSMYHGLEVRSPFLDKDLVEFAFRLPTEFKFNPMNTKIILKSIYEKELGANIVHRKKMGFGFPLEDFFIMGHAKETSNLVPKQFALWSLQNILNTTPLSERRELHLAQNLLEKGF